MTQKSVSIRANVSRLGQFVCILKYTRIFFSFSKIRVYLKISNMQHNFEAFYEQTHVNNIRRQKVNSVCVDYLIEYIESTRKD